MVKNKKLTIFSITCLGVVSAALFTLKIVDSPFPFATTDASDYVLTLNNSNRPTSFDGEGNAVTHPTSDSTVTYTGASENGSGLVNLTQGGTIIKDESKGLKSFTATFSGDLTLKTSFENGGTEYSYALTSGVTKSIVGNYFKIVAEEATSITSVAATYNCLDEAEIEFNTTYTIGAEDAIDSNALASLGGDDSIWLLNEQGVYYYGNIDTSGTKYVEYLVYSSSVVLTKVDYYVSWPADINTSKTILTNNGASATSVRTDSQTGTGGWYDWGYYEYGEILLTKGPNLLRLTFTDSVNFSNVRLSYDNSVASLSNTASDVFRREAEDADNSNAMAERGCKCVGGEDIYWRIGYADASGECYVGRFNDTVSVDNYISWDITSSEDCYVTVYYGIGAGGNVDLSKLELTINSVVTTTAKRTISQSDWYDWQSCYFGVIHLTKGTNVVTINIDGSIPMNLDYIDFAYGDTTLS